MVFVESGIEALQRAVKTSSRKTWRKLNSYSTILTDEGLSASRIILEGDPGYGKSILTLQFAYDWCYSSTESSMDKVEIFILLRLRQLRGVSSIYEAIRQFNLPNDTRLQATDIENILCGSSSVLIILDGFDEYPDKDEKITEVSDIMQNNMLQHCKVILTTRSSILPQTVTPVIYRIRLTGFDEKARDQYLRKIINNDDDGEAANKIKTRLMESPILIGLCKVPLFFVMFAHITQESNYFQKVKSVTGYFRYIISCFHNHMKNKMKVEQNVDYDRFENEHDKLNQVAFEALSSKKGGIVWNKEDLRGQLGSDFYDVYVQIGILVEEEVFKDKSNSLSPTSIKYEKEVRFFHLIFCEWYAAHYLAKYALKNVVLNKPVDVKQLSSSDKSSDVPSKEVPPAYETLQINVDNYLKNLDPGKYQYVYRFACGLNRQNASYVIQYLKKRYNDAHSFKILCIIEQERKVKTETMLGAVRKLCASTVHLRKNDSLLLQRSTLQVLETASGMQIPILRLKLIDNFNSVDASAGILHLQSHLRVPVVHTLNVLWLDEGGKELTNEEIDKLLQFSSLFLNLKSLRFSGCLLPKSIKSTSPRLLQAKKLSVLWDPRYSENWYYLNFLSCQWERGCEEMTDEEYQKVELFVRRNETR